MQSINTLLKYFLNQIEYLQSILFHNKYLVLQKKE